MSDFSTRAQEAARRYIEHMGCAVLDTAYKLPNGKQIDIVANEGNELVFIEVKARRDADKGFPSEAMSKRKREAMEAAAISWLKDHASSFVDMMIRFDVISLLVLAENRAIIRHCRGVMNGLAYPNADETVDIGDAKEPMLACATA